MEKSFIGFTLSLIMITLFSFALVSFGVYFSEGNNPAIDIRNDSEISNFQTSLNSNINEHVVSMNNSQESFFKTESEVGDLQSKSGGQFKTGISSVITSSTTIFRVGYQKIFGFDTGFGLFITALIGILTFIGVMLGYKAWFGRNP